MSKIPSSVSEIRSLSIESPSAGSNTIKGVSITVNQQHLASSYSRLSINISQSQDKKVDQSSCGSKVQILQAIIDNNLKLATSLLPQSGDTNLESIRDQQYLNLLHHSAIHNNVFLFAQLIHYQKLYLKNSKGYDHIYITNSITRWVNQRDVDGYSPGHYAAHRGSIRLFELYAESGGDIFAKSQKGLMAFHVAAQSNQALMLAYLKENMKFNPQIPDIKMASALHQACFFGGEECVNLLLSWHLPVNQQDNEGFTPLHLSIIQGHTHLVKKLIWRGADKSIKNKEGKDAYIIAKEINHQSIRKILKNSDQKLLKSCLRMSLKPIQEQKSDQIII